MNVLNIALSVATFIVSLRQFSLVTPEFRFRIRNREISYKNSDTEHYFLLPKHT